MLVCPRITDFIWRLNSCPLPLVARRFPQVPAHPPAASPGSARAALRIAKSKYIVAGLGKLKSHGTWVDHSGLWVEEHDHGSWIMDHGSRVLGASATGTEKDRDGPSHVTGLDVLTVT